MQGYKRLEGIWYILFDSCARTAEKPEIMRNGKGRGRLRLLACFNALSLKGASGTYQVETRILREAFLAAFIRHLKNQYSDLETQRLDGPTRSRSK